MKTRQTFVTISFILFLLSCKSNNEANISIEKEKVKEVFPTWIEAISNSQNAETYFDYVTDDYISLESGSYPESDKQRLLASISGLIESYDFHFANWKSEELIIRDDIAIHRHSGILILKSKSDSSKIELDMKYMDILKKDIDGNWKIHIHSNSPNK